MNNYRAYAKVNIFLKITGKRDGYHEIISRFMRVDSLYDELKFVAKEESDEFVIVGDFSCTTEQNTIYKAYKALLDAISSQPLIEFMKKNAIYVDKKIPAFAGLGGGSSDAATYLRMCNEALNLGLSRDELAVIGSSVGADVAFFVYNYESANVSGIGEIVEEFKEDVLDFEIYTPKIEISTPKVYRAYRENFYAPVDDARVQELKKMSSLEVLKSMSTGEANDLFKPALYGYDGLKSYVKDGYYFSGSGSSFFKVKDKRER